MYLYLAQPLAQDFPSSILAYNTTRNSENGECHRLPPSHPYLEVPVDQVEYEDAGHGDQELRGGVEVAQVDAQHPQLVHRLDVGRHHDLGGGRRRDGDGQVLPRGAGGVVVVVADQAAELHATHRRR